MTCFMTILILLFRYNEDDILCVSDWGKKISFYDKNGIEVSSFMCVCVE